ncbi:MAG: Ribonuclease D [Wolbachia endosymbiont of Ctenocephalides orientis wCori]|nr:MAG: Ribonuclease D [Wolbachia endosymbiont of Ctenocephalides orientis wCori]
MLISTTSELEDTCEELIAKKPKFIAVDTEFIRNSLTYYPQLSLIQISSGDKSFIVDALAPKIDLSSIKKIILNQEITKVFHSCRQDIESLLRVFSEGVPTPIFDTQIAAMFCHYYHDFIGYSKVVEQYQGITLDKIKAKNSDWLKRPLSEDQLDYAINDVKYLYDLYQILFDKLEENKRMNWFQEEMESIGDINKYLYHPKNAWRRIKLEHEGSLLTVKAVTEWQETLAQRYNINRNKVVNNAVISELISKNIDSMDEILDELKKGTKNIKEEDLSEFINIFNENEKNLEQKAAALPNIYDKSIFSILSIILETKCKENNISRKLVASKEELNGSISGQTNKLFRGWRYEFFGKSVESFLSKDLKFKISAVGSTTCTMNIEEV